MVAAASSSGDTFQTLASHFPLTLPIPTPLSHPQLIHPSSLVTEEDILLNPTNLRSWLTYINNIKDRISKSLPEPSGEVSAGETLLGPLSTPESRKGLQELTMIYERALAVFPTSFKIWKLYFAMRQSYVLGTVTNTAVKAKKANGQRGAKTKTDVSEQLAFAEAEYEWEGGLDGLVGYEEWKSLIATGERMLRWMGHLPTPWLAHLSIVLHPKCPPPFQRTYARRTFDRALRHLAPSLHGKIWGLYLRWAEQVGGIVGDRVWRRALKVDPSLTERHIAHLLAADPPRPLPAAKYMLALARKAAAGTYIPLEGKSPYQLFVDFLELAENFSEDIGLDVEETDALREEAAAAKEEEEKKLAEQEGVEPASVTGKLIRFEGPPVPVSAVKNGQQQQPPTKSGKSGDAAEVYSEDTDPASPTRLDIETIVRVDGLEHYKDQAGRLWCGLATYWIKRGEFDRANEVFEKGIDTVVTIRDFTQIFDAYTEFSETLISTLMDSIAEPDEEDEPEEIAEREVDLDRRMKDFEELMDRRPFLVNEVLLRRNPNEVVEWEKRVALYGDDDEKVVETYTKALETVNPRKAVGPLYPLYVNFAKFYEEGGSKDPETGEPRSEPDLKAAGEIFEKATRIPYKSVDELAEVWCEWAEMELRHDNYQEAIRLMQRATSTPKKTKGINFYDESLSVQARLFKSLKLWSFYVDLEESIGSVESTKAVYDKIMELKIANAQTIVNYAQFLEDNKYFEESFKVYEKGIDLFNFPIAFELWNIYLSKFVSRYGGAKLERTRDLFEQALEKCPEKFCKPLFLMYALLEEEHGLAKRAMGIYDRAATAVQDDDKFEMFTIYIAKATANFGLPATRPIYQQAIEVLPDAQTAEMCLRFAALERKLGEIDRARAIYAHASQFCDPRSNPEFWSEWNSFEIDTGSEDTFREMLRIKRSVQAAFNTEASYLAAQAQAARKGLASKDPVGDAAKEAHDPMAALESSANGGSGGGGGGGAPMFVKSNVGSKPVQSIDTANEDEDEGEEQAVRNPDAIEMDMSDEEDD